MDEPKAKAVELSIITVCYNEAGAIAETMESVLAQDYTDYEYIIKDGGSIDRTNEIIDSYIDQFKQKGVRLIHQITKDTGIYNAMNQAVRLSRGKYLYFLNAKDRLAAGSILREIFLKRNKRQYDVLYGDAIMAAGAEAALYRADMRRINRRMPFIHQSCFIRKEVFRDYNEALPICADFDLIVQLYRQGGSFHNVKLTVAAFDLSGLSSTKFVATVKERQQVLLFHNMGQKRLIYGLLLFEAAVKEGMIKYLPEAWLALPKQLYKKYRKKWVAQ